MATKPLTTLSNEIEAHMLAQRLEAEGILSWVQPMGGGYGALGVLPFIHHRIFVKEEDFEKAKKILDEADVIETE